MKIRTLLAILLSVTLGWSCKDSETTAVPSLPVPTGAFVYTSYDSTERIDETGWLLLNVSDPEHVTGTWLLSTRGTGDLRGSIENGKVVVDLYPGYSDNNYILDGMVQRGGYSGSWTQIGFAGIMASGRFEALPR